jgi:hypothetical protein
MPLSSENFLAFTVVSAWDLKVDRLVKSAAKQKVFFETRVYPDFTYTEFLDHKHLLILDVLKGAQASGIKNFLFLDGWDTVIVAPLATQMYTTPKLWFGAEKNCYPNREQASRFLQPGPFPYLNSGVIWGNVDTYVARCPREVGHDQRLWIEEYLSATRGIILDTFAGVALNLHSTKAEDLSRFVDGAVRYAPTGTWPCILHGNGKWPIPQWV